jgi:hypothetical protein
MELVAMKRDKWKPVKRPTPIPPDVECILWDFARRDFARRDIESVPVSVRSRQLDDYLSRRIHAARAVGEWGSDDGELGDDPEYIRGLIDLSFEADLAEMTGDVGRARRLRRQCELYASKLGRFI